MRIRMAPFLAAVLVAATLAGCDSGSEDSESGPIRIGLTVPLTGNYQALGTGDQQGAQIAVEQINADGGIDGRRIELVVKDDKTQPDQSVLAFNAHKNEGAVAVIGSSFSNSALAAIPLAERNSMPYISLAAADQQVDPVRKFAFQIPARSSTYAEQTLKYLQASKITKIALAHDTKSSYAVAGYEAVKEKAKDYGVTVVVDRAFDTGTQDFSAVFSPVRSSDAQAVFLWATGPPAVIATKQFAASGLTIPLVLTGAQATPLFTKPAGAAAEKVILSSAIGVIGPDLPDSDLKKAVDELATDYQKKYGTPPPQFAVDGYCGVIVLAEAIRKAGSTDGKKVQAALEELSLLTPNGRYRYTADDHSGLSTDNVAIATVTGGKFAPTPWMTQQLSTNLPK
ncbi:amino acid/amide ABC transporter substrate-binding protein, HAAT family [Cryptosporangium aurantiacum]|uniref:Amino acid/amide ABC transporter substrate-binding protein, HAAT family n=2 Tax=Cryptosporangium aurantiacum TaxID=134849 RepID=A0A1M7R6Z1_9ACTN|nr:amino acid/amide ABC transporter substrate-binding protein, HAAT family [Cryptosporangium aurantiacum]